jgi:hypothetical protein
VIWTILWILWGVFFAVVEGFALYFESKRKANAATLSEHVWKWAGVIGATGPRWWTHTRRIILALFMVELTIHFASGRWWV